MRRTAILALAVFFFSIPIPAPAAQGKRAYEIADFYRTALA